MRRTNIYLDDDKLVLLKLLAADEGTSVADIVRTAVDQWLESHRVGSTDWAQRVDSLVERVRGRIPGDLPPDEIEADISAAHAEVRR